MMFRQPYPVMGDPGILSLAGRALGAIARSPVGRAVAGVLPGGAAAITIAGGVGALARARREPPPGMVPVPGITGTFERVLPFGRTGYMRKGGHRMNAGNAKAAHRAIRRIKSVRKLLQSIERELPRRPAARGSRGVITRSEAARALRS